MSDSADYHYGLISLTVFSGEVTRYFFSTRISLLLFSHTEANYQNVHFPSKMRLMEDWFLDFLGAGMVNESLHLTRFMFHKLVRALSCV